MFLLFPILRRLLLTAAFLAIPLVAGEFVARKLVASALRHIVQARIGTAPTVGFGSTPLLLQLIRGKLDAVTLTAERARLGGLAPLALRATLRDVRLRNLTSLQGAIGSLTVDARLSPAAVRGLLATPACIDSLPANVRAALTRTPRVYLFPGRIDLLPPRARAVEVRLAPSASGTRLRFALTQLDLGGAAVSREQLALTRTRTDCSRTLRHLPFGISLVSATATTGAMDVAFTGRDASFSALG